MISVVIFALVFVGSLYAAYHPKLTVSFVSIEGNKTVSSYDIRQVVNKELSGKYLWLYPKGNGLLLAKEKVTEAIASTFPRLSSVELAQKDLQTISLTVKERQGRYLWCLPDNNCYFADKNGFVFTPAPKFSSPLYFEFLSNNAADPLGKYPLPAADLGKLITLQKQLTEALTGSKFDGQKIYQVAPAELRDWYFKVKNDLDSSLGWEIRIDLDQDPALVVGTLKSVLVDQSFIKDLEAHHSAIQYIDLRFAPKVFYRYNNQQ